MHAVLKPPDYPVQGRGTLHSNQSTRVIASPRECVETEDRSHQSFHMTKLGYDSCFISPCRPARWGQRQHGHEVSGSLAHKGDPDWCDVSCIILRPVCPSSDHVCLALVRAADQVAWSEGSPSVSKSPTEWVGNMKSHAAGMATGGRKSKEPCESCKVQRAGEQRIGRHPDSGLGKCVPENVWEAS